MIDVHKNATLLESFEGDRSRVIGNHCKMGRPGNYQEKIIMYKVVNNKAPGYLISLFEKSNSGYALRKSESRLLLPKYKTEFTKSSSSSFIGAKMWNTIPYHIRTTPTLSAFKKQINSLAVIYVLYIVYQSILTVELLALPFAQLFCKAVGFFLLM